MARAVGIGPGGNPVPTQVAPGAGQPVLAVCDKCGCRSCRCESPAPDTVGPDMRCLGAKSGRGEGCSSGGGYSFNADTGALGGYLGAVMTMERVGARLPDFTPGNLCRGGAGPCAVYMNHDGDLIHEIGVAKGGSSLTPRISLAHNSTAASSESDYGRGMVLNYDVSVTTVGDDVVLTDCLGATCPDEADIGVPGPGDEIPLPEDPME